MENICGEGCPSENTGCLIKFVDVLRNTCICRNCLIKSMCEVMCQEREDIFIDLPDWLRTYLEEIHHCHTSDGEVEYERLMKKLKPLIEELDIGEVYGSM